MKQSLIQICFHLDTNNQLFPIYLIALGIAKKLGVTENTLFLRTKS